MKRYTLMMVAVLAMLIGCVAYPTQRTYFEPVKGDGIPVATSSCGYHITKKDALEHIVDGVIITVMPEYVDGENLKLTVYIQSELEYISLQPEGITVAGADPDISLYPAGISAAMQMPSKNMPYYRQWYTLSYPVLANDINDLNVTFLQGAIGLPAIKNRVINFDFTKAKTADFYYSSINC